MSITHIPGKVVQIGPRKIQRCGVCGEKLVDIVPKAKVVQ